MLSLVNFFGNYFAIGTGIDLVTTAYVTSHGSTRYYGYFITSIVGVLTYFGARGTVPVSTHRTASTGVGRGPIGCHISFPWTAFHQGSSRHTLAHSWVGVLACKGVRQSSASPKETSLESNLGAGCESSTWDHSTQYWFATN